MQPAKFLVPLWCGSRKLRVKVTCEAVKSQQSGLQVVQPLTCPVHQCSLRGGSLCLLSDEGNFQGEMQRVEAH